jgi:hypothetical protein
MVRSQSDQDGLCQGDFKLGAKDGTYDFLYARAIARGSMYSCFRIRDILKRIRESAPLTNESGSGSCSFRQWPSRCQQKYFS